MKKLLTVSIIVIVLLASLLLVACDGAKSRSMELVYIVDGEEYARKRVNYLTMGTIPEAPPCDKEGYSFEGWYWDDEDFEVELSMFSLMYMPMSEELKVYAHFDLTKYELHYEVDEGEHSNPKTYNFEKTVVLKDAKKEGYIFKGWYLDADKTEQIKVIKKGSTGDKTLYASFEKCEDHQFDANCICVYCGLTRHELDENCICSNCGKQVHEYENCVCINCGKTNHTPSSSCICTECGEDAHVLNSYGNCTYCGKFFFSAFSDSTIVMGSYPQSEVWDTDILTALNDSVGKLPSAGNSAGWNSYGYYVDDASSDYMWYKDVELDGKKYRGVYLEAYRPYFSTSNPDSGEYQSDNGIHLERTYWFRFDPIEWKLLSSSNGDWVLVSNMILDSQEFSTTSDLNYHGDDLLYPNNYAKSSIRSWLNNNFYNTAFSELEKQIIQSSNVSNDIDSQGELYSNIRYVCENTKDKVFLLSVEELTTYYGKTQQDEYHMNRFKESTSYAMIQGLNDYSWWTRSPYNIGSKSAQVVSGGTITNCCDVNSTYVGVVPAIRINVAY